MASYRVRPGGLMRCCLLTLSEAMDAAETPPKEGDMLECAYHSDAATMIFVDGAWEWKQSRPVVISQGRKKIALPQKEHRRSNDMTVTTHALERMEERWPDLCEDLTDEEVARVIQGEINDAVLARRYGDMCPLELANNNIERWRAKKGRWYCWNEDKSRGYTCSDDPDEGLVVLTTLVGDTPQQARRKLVHRRGR